MKRIKAFFNPEQYHGWAESKSYFEGWYYKLIDKKEKNIIAIIPGVSMDNGGNKEAFIQVFDGKNQRSEYHKFDFSEFIPAPGKFEVQIRDNFFSADSIKVSLPQTSGELNFTEMFLWPKKIYSPGIMGPYSFAPFMECNHGIISMNHKIEGSLQIKGKTENFTKGRGYIEKDWGHSFPSAYIWMQSNHFSRPGVSLFASAANIPWLKKSFTGYIAALLIDNKLLKFTTYNKTVLKKCSADLHSVQLVFVRKNYLLEIDVKRDMATSLASPMQGIMNGRIDESMTSEMTVKLTDRNSGQIIFNEHANNTALDVAGDIKAIMV
jgi:tocopherol cyclase